MSLARTSVIGLALGVGLLLVLGGDARTVGTGGSDGVAQWAEVAWPFPLDQWGSGRAFRCGAAACGAELHVYLRAKVGFCNCSVGVSDDDEIDRTGDIELIGARYVPLAPGRPVTIGILRGRLRAFAVERPLQDTLPALAVGLANKCDAVVATLVTGRAIEPAHERAALAFLAGETVQRWAEANTGTSSP